VQSSQRNPSKFKNILSSPSGLHLKSFLGVLRGLSRVFLRDLGGENLYNNQPFNTSIAK
jgi:hypothetical protein